ncbi:hypothetical protein [Mucilaginibacter antarcticus]|uniref:hypothetical protein n=1 Tax=Mucilaginibacter antarcticus TaxID=1855725 RepID=UPI00363C0864
MLDLKLQPPYQIFSKPSKELIAIIGLGYVGLPLAVEFAKKYHVKGFDIKQSRISELKNNHDNTLEIESDILSEVQKSSQTQG